MDRWEKGMLAKSLAGHDKGKVYVIINIEETMVYLADGENRTLDKLKKKKKKHIQIIKNVPEEVAECYNDMEALKDEMIRKAIKVYKGKIN